MKKNYLLLVALLAFTSGCGGNEKTSTTTSLKESSNSALVSQVVSSSSSSSLVTYKVKVLNKNGEVIDGVAVQLCDLVTGMCTMSNVDSTGLATFSLEKAKYDIHLLFLPENYAFNSKAYTLDENNHSVEIILDEFSDFVSGDGSETSPYSITSEGVYKVIFDSREHKLNFSFLGEGDYNIFSAGDYRVDILANDSLTSGFETSFKDSLNFQLSISSLIGNDEFIFFPVSIPLYITKA